MHPIDEFLARALLREEPSLHRDVVPRQEEDASLLPQDSGPLPAPGRQHSSHTAADDLQTLCETVVAQTAAYDLKDFLTEKLPAPPGARVLGCILQLADAEDGARFWWQYAAGAGDDVASYCLYLHHLALGEIDAAAWWRQQTQVDTHPAPETTPLSSDRGRIRNLDSSTPTVLRVLGRLLHRVDRPRTELVDAMLGYVPTAIAIGYIDNPDFEIPLPRQDFADHITVILAISAALTNSKNPAPQKPFDSPRLSRRRPAANMPRPSRPEHTRVKYLQPGEGVRGSHR
ncbi:hypothetical protein OG239_42495 (plasmid) [Streptomyces sp. NBC_00868]|uniref:hypothetical protein n=1 Tax=Streptomyces sp. NBC_00868 TaxID=2903683 RepID=UPI002F917DFD|nr:hypothetical protein OG239_42495 [Streptomyces sp. NBC_00868]